MKKLITIYLVAGLILAASDVTQAGFTTVKENPGGEPDLYTGLSSNPLGNIMDTLFGLGNYMRVDDADDQIWSNNSAGEARCRARYSAYGSTLLYNSSTHPSLSVVISPSVDGTFAGTWTPLPVETEQFNWIMSSSGGGPSWSSRQIDNIGNEDHLVTFEIIGGSGNTIGNYVLAWEDLPFSSPSDKDYQDFVVEVSVPEPATICLLGLGALSLIRRKK